VNLKFSKVFLMPMILMALVVLSIPALAAENATISGDGVDMYKRPYFSSPVIAHLPSGKRVEVIGWAHFRGAVEGYTKPWYRVSTGSGEGFIHGKFLATDTGMKIPMLPTVFEVIDPCTSEPCPEWTLTPENATITGDKVNVREEPAIWQKTKGTLDKGTRVEVEYVSDFTDTVEGHTAPWYFIECEDGLLSYGDSGFVFGRYVALDPGAAPAPLPRSHSSYVDPIERFIQQGLHAFGVSEAAIIKNLGRPVSIKESRSEDNYILDGYVVNRRLTYRDIVIEIRTRAEARPDNRDDIHLLSTTGNAYSFDGLRVGGTAADVRRVLGAPAEETVESLTYRDGVLEVHEAVFRLRGGAITEIILDATYND
jgi:hypothetical protein